MKKLLDYECALDFIDLLIERVEGKLDINPLDYPIDDEGKPMMDNVIAEYLIWAASVALKVEGASDLEAFIEKSRVQLHECQFFVTLDDLRKLAYDMIDNCTDEIRAWTSVTASFLTYNTINEKMINGIAEDNHIYE